MPDCPNPRAQRPHGRRLLSRRLDALHREEGGAVLLLSLAAILILMMMVWVIMDAGTAARDRLDAQASADVSAYSHAAVKARSMNMMAYANIAKRSIVGIHSLYPAMIDAYRDWINLKRLQCLAGDQQACEDAETNRNQLLTEEMGDYTRFEQNGESFYAADIRALDNYQFYLVGMSPWWAWSEAVVRAQRNSAKLASTYPPPWGVPTGNFVDLTQRVSNEAGSGGEYNTTSRKDSLPVRRGSYQADMLEQGMRQTEYLVEHGANASLHKSRSALGAAENWTVQLGATAKFAARVVPLSESTFGEHGKPWVLQTTTEEARWLLLTSAVSFVYRPEEELFTGKREKFSVPSRDHEWTDESQKHYRPKGYWGMARSEISFQSDAVPDMWHPMWVARMRPISLPQEFAEGGYDLNAMYHDIIPSLSLSATLSDGAGQGAEEDFDDLVFMERASRGLGQSTIEGVGK